MTILLEFPLSIVQWAHLTRLQPPWDAMEMERMIAYTPSDGAFIGCGRCLIGLAFNAQIHDVIAANSTIVDDNVPSPQCNGTPFLNLKAFFRCFVIAAAGLLKIIFVNLHLVGLLKTLGSTINWDDEMPGTGFANNWKYISQNDSIYGFGNCFERWLALTENNDKQKKNLPLGLVFHGKVMRHSDVFGQFWQPTFERNETHRFVSFR